MAAIGHHRYQKQVGTLQLCRMDGTKIFFAFQNMETLLKNVNLPTNYEQKLCDELNGWNIKGNEILCP